MAFENRSKGKYITISAKRGKFSETVPEGTPGSETRINKKGRTVHELFHDSFVGKLVGIRTKGEHTDEYGKSWIFDFEDTATRDVYHLQMSYSNKLSSALLKMLPNIDVTREFKLTPSMKIEDGIEKTSLFVNQDGQSVKYAYTRENPNGLPSLEKIVVKGKETWDDTNALAFLEEMVNRDIIHKLQNPTPTAGKPSEETDEFGTAPALPNGNIIDEDF